MRIVIVSQLRRLNSDIAILLKQQSEHSSEIFYNRDNDNDNNDDVYENDNKDRKDRRIERGW